MARCPSSVRPSVNFCANRFFSQANGRIATKLAHDGHQVSLHPGCAQVKVKVKGHVIRELSWILGMSYSVIDGLVSGLNHIPTLGTAVTGCGQTNCTSLIYRH